MQLSIALLSLAIAVVYHLVKFYADRKQRPKLSPNNGQSLSIPPRSPDSLSSGRISPHMENSLRYLSEFHKLKCYYSITLQIALLIAQYGPSSTTHSIRNPFDEAFLLLLSINGILPIALVLYTLALFDKVTLYLISVTSLSVIFASDTGITIVKLLSEPYDSAKGTRGSSVDWPAATGGLAPEAICGRRYIIKYPKKLKPETVFMVGAVLCDALLAVLIVRWCIEKWSARPSSPYQSRRSEKMAGLAKSAGHIAAAAIFLFCTGKEYFFFYQMLVPQHDRIVNFQDWGFEQIVGIAVWAVVILDFARHEISMLE